MIRRLDQWIGKHIFHPPIIWICQRTGFSQYQLSRYLAWIGVAIFLVICPRSSWSDFLLFTLIAIILVVRTILLGVGSDRPMQSLGSTRFIALFAIAYNLLRITVIFVGYKYVSFEDLYLAGSFLIMATAEYALTITTIPPHKNKKKKSSNRTMKTVAKPIPSVCPTACTRYA